MIQFNKRNTKFFNHDKEFIIFEISIETVVRYVISKTQYTEDLLRYGWKLASFGRRKW